MTRSLFIGRWQPFHAGHKALIETALSTGNEVILGIRDTELSRDNPLSVLERVEMLQDAFNGRVQLCAIPDFEELCYGRAVGYTFRQIELSPEIEAISGTAIRQAKGVLWLTGNSGTGKTTLARTLKRVYWPWAVMLDGDEMRESISVGAGFFEEERLRHNLRVARLARVLIAQGHMVIVSVIAPTERIRKAIEKIISPLWVYVKRELPEREGFFYDSPVHPDLTVDTDLLCPDECAELCVEAFTQAEGERGAKNPNG